MSCKNLCEKAKYFVSNRTNVISRAGCFWINFLIKNVDSNVSVNITLQRWQTGNWKHFPEFTKENDTLSFCTYALSSSPFGKFPFETENL